MPPDQSARIPETLRAKGFPVAFMTFAEEGHGFRQAQSVRRSLEAELYFYGRVFGFTPAGDIEAIAIDNLPLQGAE